MPKDSALGIISENLTEAQSALESGRVMKNAHVCELAYALRDQFGDPEYIKGVVEKAALEPADLAVFAMDLAKYVDKDHESLPFFAYTDVSLEPMTAYFRNSISDMAFSVFSREIKELRAVYYGSFSACAEDVSSGISDCCMLPIYDFSDGEMWSVRRLMEKHDLSIVMTVDLPTSFEASNFVRFALLSREPQMPKDANMLRVTAFFRDPSELTSFLDGCRAIGKRDPHALTALGAHADPPLPDLKAEDGRKAAYPLAKRRIDRKRKLHHKIPFLVDFMVLSGAPRGLRP